MPVVIATLALSAARPSVAADENGVRVAARALGFLENAPSGTTPVAILYAPDDAQSSADAAALQKLMANGGKIGNIILRPVLQPIDGTAPNDADVLFLAENLGARASKAAEIARTRHLPCITFDIEQVKNGNCAIGIRSEPRIEILVKKDVALKTGINFAGAFRMLVTEF